MKKLLACDLDGTLIKHNIQGSKYRSILAEDKKAVHDFISEGNIYLVSTGRDIYSTLKGLDYYGLPLTNSYYITSNGSEIYDCNQDLIYQQVLSNKSVYQTLEYYFLNNDGTLMCSVFDGQNVTDINSKKDIEYFNIDSVINICIASKEEDILKMEGIANDLMSTVLDANIHRNNWYVDIINPLVSKATAMKYVIDLLDDKLYVAAIGDSWNDVPMFEIADRSYTFNNSNDVVKKKADIHIDHVYQCLDDLMKLLRV